MIIIGCDFHASFQQVAVLDTESGEYKERKLMHATGEAEQFYRRIGTPSLVGMESVGNSQWFVQLLERLGHEVRIGDAARIRASYVRKQKTDKRDASHILKLLSLARSSSAYSRPTSVKLLLWKLFYTARQWRCFSISYGYHFP